MSRTVKKYSWSRYKSSPHKDFRLTAVEAHDQYYPRCRDGKSRLLNAWDDKYKSYWIQTIAVRATLGKKY